MALMYSHINNQVHAHKRPQAHQQARIDKQQDDVQIWNITTTS